MFFIIQFCLVISEYYVVGGTVSSRSIGYRNTILPTFQFGSCHKFTMYLSQIYLMCHGTGLSHEAFNCHNCCMKIFAQFEQLFESMRITSLLYNKNVTNYSFSIIRYLNLISITNIVNAFHFV